MLIVGAPLKHAGGLFNTAVVIRQGSVLGVVPKTYLPNYREFYEQRHFTSGAGIHGRQIRVAGRQAPFGVDLLFRSTGVKKTITSLCAHGFVRFWSYVPGAKVTDVAEKCRCGSLVCRLVADLPRDECQAGMFLMSNAN